MKYKEIEAMIKKELEGYRFYCDDIEFEVDEVTDIEQLDNEKFYVGAAASGMITVSLDNATLETPEDYDEIEVEADVNFIVTADEFDVYDIDVDDVDYDEDSWRI